MTTSIPAINPITTAAHASIQHRAPSRRQGLQGHRSASTDVIYLRLHENDEQCRKAATEREQVLTAMTEILR
jgi:hypothetical protein